ncbi:MAG: winged helix-turn-helix transcriptional regulator [Bacteroidaceae bacterium]|nr:winged helix-turn-helix transcriptional regulator [Bacteroidaceae bacterium]
MEAIKETPSISRAELSKRLKISERQIRKITDQLRKKGILIREGGNSGKWIINKI